MSPSRERLLDEVVEHLAAHGAHDLTLRGLATAIGTSHRMLSYHFGSREGLLVAVTRAVEQRQREALADLVADPGAAPLDVMRQMYERLSDPALWPQERLFFDLYARALHAGSDAEPLLEGVIDAWVPGVAQLFVALGFGPDEAADEARLAIAVSRGMLLDLLATGDRAAADRVFDRYVARYEDR